MNCDNQDTFLYLLVKEKYPESKGKKVDTELRIVYWPEDADSGHESQFVIYGKRPRSKTTGEFIPYRVKCHTMNQVYYFAKNAISSDHDLSIELHQFSGFADDNEDEYNIAWYNTAENSSTEIVAFDVYSNPYEKKEYYIDFYSLLKNQLNILSHFVTV